MHWSDIVSRWRGTPLLLVFLGLGMLGVATMSCGLALALLWAFGDVRSASEGWTVVVGVSSVVAAGASLVTAAAVGLAAAEFERNAAAREAEERRDRVSRWPYIRADIGFADYLRQPGFSPPDAHHTYSLSELGVPAGATASLNQISAPKGSGHALILWLTNLQHEPLGVADEVRVTVGLRWRVTAREPVAECAVEIVLAYLAPRQTTAVRLVVVASGIELVADVQDVRYHDLFGLPSRDTHGAMVMWYDGVEVRNERKAARFREGHLRP